MNGEPGIIQYYSNAIQVYICMSVCLFKSSKKSLSEEILIKEKTNAHMEAKYILPTDDNNITIIYFIFPHMTIVYLLHYILDHIFMWIHIYYSNVHTWCIYGIPHTAYYLRAIHMKDSHKTALLNKSFNSFAVRLLLFICLFFAPCTMLLPPFSHGSSMQHHRYTNTHIY